MVCACSDDADPGPSRKSAGRYTVVWLSGSHYEMGYQHGQLLKEELRDGVKSIDDDVMLKAMFVMAEMYGVDKMAKTMSYPYILDECRGMVDAIGKETGWTMNHCLVLNFGDVASEYVSNGKPTNTDITTPGCSQVVADKTVTGDGRLYHARILDWMKVDYIVKYPVIFVRRPSGGVPHVVIGFPGNLSPYQGMNAAGLSVASNEAHAKDASYLDLTGRSHVQLVGKILGEARSMAAARAMIQKTNHMTFELITIADGNTGEGSVFEMAPGVTEERKLKDGVVYATNHFLGAKASTMDRDPVKPDSQVRMDRLDELLGKTHKDSMLGKLTAPNLVKLMRDRKHAKTGIESAATVVDDGKSLATNGALYELVFDPAGLRFWVAAGALPVPQQKFEGFSLGELLNMEGHQGATPSPIP